MAAAALSSTLGAASYALLEEAGVAEYVAETLTGVLDEGGGMTFPLGCLLVKLRL